MAKALEEAEKEKTHVTGTSCEHQKCMFLGESRGIPPEKILKSGPLEVHFQHSGEKIKVFEQNTDIL